VIAQIQKWLETTPWEYVVEQNQKLCETARVPHELVPERHDQVRKLWETAAAQDTELHEALEVLQQCIEQGPFRYNNPNTFSAVARRLVEGSARALPPVEGQILTSTVCQYVEAKVSKAELRQVISHFAKHLQAAPVESPARPAAAPVRAQPQTT
jgi:hypothetical protein